MGNNRVSRHALALTMLIGAFLAGASTSSHAIAATNNVGLPVIPLYFTNQINSVSSLFIWIFGVTNQDATGILIKSQVYVTNIQGDITITPAIPTNAPISLSINVGSGTENEIMLPKLSGIRIYSSLGAGLLTQNGGWLAAGSRPRM